MCETKYTATVKYLVGHQIKDKREGLCWGEDKLEKWTLANWFSPVNCIIVSLMQTEPHEVSSKKACWVLAFREKMYIVKAFSLRGRGKNYGRVNLPNNTPLSFLQIILLTNYFSIVYTESL